MRRGFYFIEPLLSGYTKPVGTKRHNGTMAPLTSIYHDCPGKPDTFRN